MTYWRLGVICPNLAVTEDAISEGQGYAQAKANKYAEPNKEADVMHDGNKEGWINDTATSHPLYFYFSFVSYFLQSSFIICSTSTPLRFVRDTQIAQSSLLVR